MALQQHHLFGVSEHWLHTEIPSQNGLLLDDIC